MNLDLIDDQRMLKDMLDRFASERGGLEAHRAAIATDIGWSRDRWTTLAELGLLALFLDEPQGGLAGGGTELMLVGEAMGRGLLSEPYVENAVVAAPILAHTDAAEELAALLDGTWTCALVKGGIAWGDGRLNGSTTMVAAGDGADAFIVHVGGEGLFLLAADARGVTREGYPLHGGGRAADVRFDDAAALRIAGAGAAGRAVEAAGERRLVFISAEALGLASFAMDVTIDYLKTRVQFGQPIGANQALQHRAAEMYVELEQLRSAVILAACSLDESDAEERRRVMAATALVTAKASRFIAQQAVQLHGGIGVTEEHAIGHCFLRLTAIGLLLEGDRQVQALAQLGGFVSASSYWTAR